MTEPKTIKKARDITLAKIKECMKRPRKGRQHFWKKTVWKDQEYPKNYCAFCIVADEYNYVFEKECICIVREICNWFEAKISSNYGKKDLRKLYAMVKEIEC